MENIKILAMVFCAGIWQFIAAMRLGSIMDEMFRRTFDVSPAAIFSTQNFAAYVSVAAILLVFLIMFVGKVSSDGWLLRVFYKKLILVSYICVIFVHIILSFFILQYASFGYFAVATLRVTWALDYVRQYTLCMDFNMFQCLFPSSFNYTLARVCSYIEVSGARYCRDNLLFDTNRSEKIFLMASITSSLIIISLAETLFYINIRFAKCLIFPNLSLPIKFCGLNDINFQLSTVWLTIASIICFLGVIVFSITFSRAATLFYEVVDECYSGTPEWITTFKTLYVSMAFCSFFTGFLFVCFYYSTSYLKCRIQPIYHLLLHLLGYATFVLWICILASISAPTGLAILFECICKEVLEKSSKNIPDESCIDIGQFAMGLFHSQFVSIIFCGNRKLMLCNHQEKAKPLFITSLVFGVMIPLSIIVFIMATPFSNNNTHTPSQQLNKSDEQLKADRSESSKSIELKQR